MPRGSLPFSFRVEQGVVEDIGLSGTRRRKSTVLIRVGSYSFSRRALQLGVLMLLCQVLDGILTFVGLSLLGVHMEGNTFLRTMMEIYGMAPMLLLVKLIAIAMVFVLTIEAHRRRWIRPMIISLILVYIAAAIIPWAFILSDALVKSFG